MIKKLKLNIALSIFKVLSIFLLISISLFGISQPTITSVVVAANNSTATVNFSGPVYSNNDKTGDLLNGDLSVGISGGTATLSSFSFSHTAGSASGTITLTLANGPADGTETIEVGPSGTGVIWDDATTPAPMLPTELASAMLNDKEQPTYVSSKILSLTSIEVVFSESLSASDKTKFTSSDNDFTVSNASHSGNTVTLTVSGLSAGDHNVDLDLAADAVTDDNGNGNASHGNINVPDGIPPLFVNARAETKTKIRLFFNENVSSPDKTKFSATNLPGISTAVVENNDEVVLNLSSDLPTDYTASDLALATGAVADTHSNAIVSITGQTITDKIKPEFVSAKTTSPTNIQVTFSEPIKSPVLAEFKPAGATETAVAVDGDNTKVNITIDPVNSDYSDNLDLDANAVQDLANNQLDDANTNDIDDGLAPSFVKAEAVSTSTIEITFNEDLNSSVDKTKFSATGLSISSASRSGSIVTLNLSSNIPSNYSATDLDITAGAVKDAATVPNNVGSSTGNTISDKIKPVFVSAITTSPTNIQVTFSEPIKSPILNEFKPAGATETAVAVDGDNTKVNITIDAVNSDYADNLDLDNNAVQDLANNQIIGLNTNPISDGIAPSVVLIEVKNSNPDELVVEFDENMNLQDGDATGFSINGIATTITGASVSGSDIMLALSADIVSGETFNLVYNDPDNAEDANNNKASSFDLAVDNNVKPILLSAVVLNANKNQIIATFDDIIDSSPSNDLSGWEESGVSGLNYSSVTGMPGKVLTFTTNKDVLVSDALELKYDKDASNSDAVGSLGEELPDFTFIVDNQVAAVAEPSEHISNFNITASSNESASLTWTDAGGAQAPEYYLVVGIDNLTGTFPSPVDLTPIPDDINWDGGVWAQNLTLPFTQPLVVTGMTSGREYTFRVYSYTNQGVYVNYKTDGTIPEEGVELGVASTSILANGTGAATYASITDSKSEALSATPNFSFDIQDDGASPGGDNAPTLIKQIVIHRGGADQTGSWVDVIAGVTLDRSGASNINSEDHPAKFTITADQITITDIPYASGSDLGYVADNATNTYELNVWLQTDIVGNGVKIDNKKLVFNLSDTDVTVESVAFPKSSGLTTSSAASGDTKNLVTVTATELFWKDFSGFSTAHTNFNVTVQATDANKNRDYDKTGLVVMVETSAPSGGYFESEGYPNDTDENLVAGQFTRTDMQVHLPGTYTVKATLAGLNDGFTGPHIFIDGNTQSDIIATNFDPPDNIPYHLFQESTINGDGVGDIKVAEFMVRDGGTIRPTADSDGAPTSLTDIVFNLTNSGFIREVALHDGTSIIDRKPGNATITFNDITTISAADDGDAVFSIFLSFNSNVTDNENFKLTVSSATSTGSTYAAANAGGAATPILGDDNKIEVTATKLDMIPASIDAIQGKEIPLQLEPKVYAHDLFNNLDLDFNNAATVTSSATFTNEPTSFGNGANGILDFAGFRYTSAGAGTLSISSGGLSTTSNAIDVIHTTFRNLDLDQALTSNNNTIEAGPTIKSGGQNKALLGFGIKSIQNTSNEPKLNKITVDFNAVIDESLKNVRLIRSATEKYGPTYSIVTYNRIENSTQITFDNILGESLNATEKFYFILADIDSLANNTTPNITPTIVNLTAVSNSPLNGAQLSSGSATSTDFFNIQLPNVEITGREYEFKDEFKPEIKSLAPFNGNENFSRTGILKLQFNEDVLAYEPVIHIHDLATDTLVSTLTAINYTGTKLRTYEFNPESPTSGYPLVADINYYVKIDSGNAVTLKGFRDVAGNSFNGIKDNNTWVFKTSDEVPPVFAGISAVNVIDKGFDLKVALDEEGILYYTVLSSSDPVIALFPPTAQSIRDASYGTPLDNGELPILYGNEDHYRSVFDPSFSANDTYRVYVIADDISGNMMGDADVAFIDVTLSGAIGAGVIVQNTSPLNTPIDVCVGDPQVILPPINIVEGENGDFNDTGGLQTINLVLPSDFQFDTTLPTVTGYGGDIISVSRSYLSNSILQIKFDVNGTNSRDKLVIEGLKIKALGIETTAGAITRLGGNAIPSIADEDVLIKFNTTRIDDVKFETVPNTNSIGNINDKIPLIPDLGPLDKGERVFSGPGVVGEYLYTTASGLGIKTITFNYKDERGCVSEYSLQRSIFDSNNAIDGLQLVYNSDDPISDISAQGRANYDLIQLTVEPAPEQLLDEIPAEADTLNPFIIDVTNSLGQNGPDFEFNPGEFSRVEIYKYFINEEAGTNNGGFVGELLFTGYYQNDVDALIKDTLEQRVKIYFAPIPEINIGANDVDIGDDTFDALNKKPYNSTGEIFDEENVPYGPELEFCYDETINLKGSGGSGGFFSISIPYLGIIDSVGITGLTDNKDGSGTLNVKSFVDGLLSGGFRYGEIIIKHTVLQPESNGEFEVSQTIRINPKPVANFMLPTFICEDRNLLFEDATAFSQADSALVEESSGLRSNAIFHPISTWEWFFNDPDAGPGNLNDSDLKQATHSYSAGRYDVDFNVTDDYGCSASVTTSITVGAIPVVDFNFAGTSLNENLYLQSTSSVEPSTPSDEHDIEQVMWDLKGDGVFEINNNDNNPTEPNDSIFVKTPKDSVYREARKYNIKFIAISTTGCKDSLIRPIMMLQNELIGDSEDTYNEDFNTDASGWVSFSEITDDWDTTGVNSWNIGSALANTQGNAWQTGQYAESEQSYVYSPTFDLKLLDRPMIEIDIWKDLASQDGVLLEYSIDSLNILDPAKKWIALGKRDEGINWFNSVGLSGSPGNDITGLGWDNADGADFAKQWITAKHDLAEVYIGGDRETVMSRINFRFGLGASESQKIDPITQLPLTGFGFDNVFMGNRTRTVLLENFTSMAGSLDNGEQNALINDLVEDPTGAELVVISYHNSFDGDDQLNKINPAAADARALYYGITKSPRVAIDGSSNPFNQSENNLLFEDWGEKFYSQRTLEIAPFDIDLAVSEVDGKLNIKTTFNANRPGIDNNIILHTVVLVDELKESDLNNPIISSGESYFKSTMLSMLPNAAGTRIIVDVPLQETDIKEVEVTWNPIDLKLDWNSPDSTHYTVVVFIQDEVTKEIHQAEAYVVPNSSDLILNIEDQLQASDISLYPNPANNEITIQLANELRSEQTAIIFDNTGRMVEEVRFNAGQDRVELNTSSYVPGIYLFTLPTDDGAILKRFIISHN